MISALISAIVATFIVLFIVNKNGFDEGKPYFMNLNEMFTKQNLVDTIMQFKTPRAWFVLVVVFLFAIIF